MSRYDKLVKKQVKKLKLDKSIIFTGYVSQNKMYKYFNVCDVVVTPSSYEPFGMVNIQAVKLGKPLIATKTTGSVEVIKDYPGLKIVQPDSSQEIEIMLENILSTNKKIINYDFNLSFLSWPNMVKNIEKLFKTLTVK